MLKKNKLVRIMATIFLFNPLLIFAQDTSTVNQPYLFFPYPMGEKKWHISLGYTMTALPEDITEEVQVRVPVIDIHAIRKLTKSLYLDGRIQTQVVQSLFSAGIRWAFILNDRLSLSVGDDFSFWYGSLEVASFNTNANGWQNFPNASLGYRFNDKVLMTLKGEALISINSKTTIAKEIVETKGSEFSGWAGSLLIEQPLGKKSHIVTGFRAQYTNFFWQTWPLFETFDRRIFYPELIVSFIL